MAKKKSSAKYSAGTKIRVKPGVTVPEFPEVTCEGWSGRIAELTGKTSAPKYVVEWDEATIQSMPPEFVERCEQQGLFYRMACFTGEQIEPMDE